MKISISVIGILLMVSTVSAADAKFEIKDCSDSISVKYCTTLIRPDGSKKQFPTQYNPPAISPNQQLLAYYDGKRLDIYDVIKDGVTFSMPLTHGNDAAFQKIVWSPGNRRLAFTGLNGCHETGHHVIVADIQTHRKTNIPAHIFKTCAASASATDPFWSPDGRYLGILEVKIGTDWHARFVVLAPDSGKVVWRHTLPPDVDVNGPYGWTPDGTALSYTAKDGKGISQTKHIPFEAIP